MSCARSKSPQLYKSLEFSLLWCVNAAAARALLTRLGPLLDQCARCCGRRAQRTLASRYVQDLLNDSKRKSMQPMHVRLGDPGSYQELQHFVTYSSWDHRPLWQYLRTGLPVARGILAIDDTGLPEQGEYFVGVPHR